MGLHRVDIDVADLDGARSISAALEELVQPAPLAVTAFEAGPGAHRVSAYYEGAPDLARLQASLADCLAPDLAHCIAGALTASEVPDENWVAVSQAALPPVTAGRFTVHGSHDRGRIPRGPHAIEIDAGEAFGTAHHATTSGCLLAIDALTRRRAFRRVLDLGSGSGVLAIAAARALPRAAIVASDIDPLATDVARQNVAKNIAGRGRLAVITAKGLAHPRLRGRRFDLIIANILANPLIVLAGGLARISPPEGHLVLSGLLTGQAAQVSAAYRAAGFALLQHRRIAGWSTLTLRRLGPGMNSAASPRHARSC